MSDSINGGNQEGCLSFGCFNIIVYIAGLLVVVPIIIQIGLAIGGAGYIFITEPRESYIAIKTFLRQSGFYEFGYAAPLSVGFFLILFCLFLFDTKKNTSRPVLDFIASFVAATLSTFVFILLFAYFIS